jgi:hypothetical protein
LKPENRVCIELAAEQFAVERGVKHVSWMQANTI